MSFKSEVIKVNKWLSNIFIQTLILFMGILPLAAQTHHFAINTTGTICAGLNQVEIEAKLSDDITNLNDNQTIKIVSFIGETSKTQTTNLVAGKKTVEFDLKTDRINMVQIMAVNNSLLVAYKDLTPVQCKEVK